MTDSSAPPTHTPPPPRVPGSGFFGWLRSLGIVRHDGWIGGVASGVAARLGIDPLLVRGILIALGLLGAPVLLVYAIAWALLPDERGSIHAENMLRGQWDGPMIAILIVVVLSIVPVVPWFTGMVFWPLAGWNDSLFDGGSTIIALALVALVVVAIVKASKNRRPRPPINGDEPVWPSPAPSAPAPNAAPADGTIRAATPSAFAAAANPHTASTPAADPYADPAHAPAADDPYATAPLPPAAADGSMPGAVPAGYDQWRRQHEQWLAGNDQWRRQQADAEAATRAARDQARQESRARAEELGRQTAAATAARRAANPRMSFAFVAVVIGVGIVAAAVTALLVQPSGVLVAGTAALLVAAIVGGLGMALAGVLRRRSGFLTAVTVTTLAIAAPLGIAAVPLAESTTASALTQVGTSVEDSLTGVTLVGSAYIYPAADEQSFVQLSGQTTIEVPEGSGTGRVIVAKAAGHTDIWVSPGTAIALDATLANGRVKVQTYEADSERPTASTPAANETSDGSRIWKRTFSAAAPGTTPTVTVPITIAQRDDVTVHVQSAPADAGTGTGTETDTDTDTEEK